MVLITVARISERKNQLGVLEALARLRRSADLRFHYLVVGNVDSPEHGKYLATLMSFAEAHGLADWLSVVAGTTDAEKADLLDASDLFVMLSRPAGASVEGFGIAPIEAASRGKPVLVSTHGGMPETVVDGVTGLVLPHDDTIALADAILSLARDPSRRRAMGEAGRAFARRHFTPAAVASVLQRRLGAGWSHGIHAARVRVPPQPAASALSGHQEA
jgi:glycosyltransferase involved in cell wall biosynthesis